MVFVTDPAPDFECEAFFKGQMINVKLSDYKGKYLVLFFYPLDFTFVCPTEILEFSEQAEKFKKNNCEIVACSVDSNFSHMQWCAMPRNKGGLGEMNIPILGDLTKKVSQDYNVLLKSGIALRATFIIDGKGILRHMSVNDLPVGRNVDEVLRLVQAFQFTDIHGDVCPAKWKKQGDPTMVPKVGDQKTQQYFEKEHK